MRLLVNKAVCLLKQYILQDNKAFSIHTNHSYVLYKHSILSLKSTALNMKHFETAYSKADYDLSHLESLWSVSNVFSMIVG